MGVIGLIFLLSIAISKGSCAQECGLQKAYTVQTVINGNTAASGQFPWTVSLFHGSDYKCGGTILDSKHVLTAAHCVKPFKTESIRIFFGRYNLADKNENTWILRNVSEAFIHEDFGKKPGNHDADIAVQKLSKPITFTDKIQPICLPEADEKLEDVVGTVVGYGQNEIADQHENIPRYIKSIKVIDPLKCMLSDSRYFFLVSLRTFCAGGMGKGPCRGDSGGGFLMKSKRNNRWTLYGIVAASLYDPLFDTCDVDKHAVYTNIFDFLDWIKVITEAENSPIRRVVRGKKEYVGLYHFDGGRTYYTFELFENTTIDTKTSEIASDRDDDVTRIAAKRINTISYLPINVADVFPNLIRYYVLRCSVTEISKENFHALKKLEVLNLQQNKISSIDKDTFEDLISLKVLSLNMNQLTSLHEDTLSNNRELQDLYLEKNQFDSLPSKLLQTLNELKRIALDGNKLKTLGARFFSNCLKLEKIWLQKNQIEHLSSNTFTELMKLEKVDLEGNKCISKTYDKNVQIITHEDLSKLSVDLVRNCSQRTA